MPKKRIDFSVALLALFFIFHVCPDLFSKDVIRPEEIKSKREVFYSQETYARLAGQWQEYYNAYPSEYAYANWMRAADYAQDSSFSKLLDKGFKKYPANPTLLYLKSLERAGTHNDTEARAYLERAAALDPDFMAPWFSLVPIYMDARDEERLNLALRHILENGAVADEVMDYNYNMISTLEPNAILITNGDNDTFPGWILSRILKFRPDVIIVNRSLLNTDWYPLYVIEQGLPRFIEPAQLTALREALLEAVRKGKEISVGGLFSDTLILRLVESSGKAGRPVYLSKTVYMTEDLKSTAEKGRDLGMVIMLTPSAKPYATQLRETCDNWLSHFRTGGLASWRLRNSPQSDAGRMLVKNYGYCLAGLLDSVNVYAPQLLGDLFKWYVKWGEEMGNVEDRGKIAQAWCRYGNQEGIKDWCQKQGLSR